MQADVTNRVLSYSRVLNHLNRVAAGVSLAVGVTLAGVLPAIAYAGEPATTLQAQPPASAASLADGVYVYGQSAQADQIGQGYFVFEVNKGTVVGALYMPRSSFDCASGTFQESQLSLTVVNSYDRSTNPFNIALQHSTTIATTGNPAFQKVSLQGFHQLSTVSQNDYRMLSVCKADMQKQAKK
jgi:hypothetical protein